MLRAANEPTRSAKGSTSKRVCRAAIVPQIKSRLAGVVGVNRFELRGRRARQKLLERAAWITARQSQVSDQQ